MLILDEAEIRDLVDAETARPAIEGAFRALHRGEATLASVISLPFRDPEGVAHIKAGHLHDDGVWTVKVSTDFDPGDGGATRHGGLMLVISATDGTLVGVLGDNGFLTELRTGAAGAVAADLLARRDVTTAAIVGAGSQARYQLEALLQVRPIELVQVASRSPERARAFVDEIAISGSPRGCAIPCRRRCAAPASSSRPRRRPFRSSKRLGSMRARTSPPSARTSPSKQELAPDVLARASVVAVDDRRQAASFGELHHAIEAGLRTEDDVVTLGELLEGVAPGRVGDEEITVADLTGVGVQDAAIAALVLREASRAQVAELEPQRTRR